MKNISEMNIIQIDITNSCTNSCSNCTRFCGHYTKDRIYYMNKDYFIAALTSLKDFDGIVGIIGKDVLSHPLAESLFTFPTTVNYLQDSTYDNFFSFR